MTDPLLEKLLKSHLEYISCQTIENLHNVQVLEYELNEKLEKLDSVLNGTIYEDIDGIKGKHAFCILAKDSDVWIADSYENLINFSKLEQQINQLKEENKTLFQTNAELHTIIDDKAKKIISLESQLENQKELLMSWEAKANSLNPLIEKNEKLQKVIDEIRKECDLEDYDGDRVRENIKSILSEVEK